MCQCANVPIQEILNLYNRPRPYGRTCLFYYDGACTGGSRTAPTNTTFTSVKIRLLLSLCRIPPDPNHIKRQMCECEYE